MEDGKDPKTVALSSFASALYLCAFFVLVSIFRTAHDTVELSLFYSPFLAVMIINAIAGVYYFLNAVLPGGSLLFKTVFLLDVWMDILVGASIGAGWTIFGFIIWPGCLACNVLHCGHLLAALILSTTAFGVSVFLITYIVHVAVNPFLVDYNV